MIVQPVLGLVNGIKSTGKNYVNLIFKPTHLCISYDSSLGFFQPESTLKLIAFLSLLHINLLSFLI